MPALGVVEPSFRPRADSEVEKVAEARDANVVLKLAVQMSESQQQQVQRSAGAPSALRRHTRRSPTACPKVQYCSTSHPMHQLMWRHVLRCPSCVASDR